jgi:uncharacterized lipoprotein YddW (UPF0748 family)
MQSAGPIRNAAAARQRVLGAALVALSLVACSSQLSDSAQPSPTAPVTPSPTPSPIALDPPQYRALWVDAFHDGIKSHAQVEKLIADARRANINALIVQVRKRGDAYFNVSDEPRAGDIVGAFDPLAYLIQLAHAAVPRIEVHAWLNTFFVGQTSAIYKLHGAQWGNRSLDGSQGGYFDPGVPEAQAYTHMVFMDVARNYDVDGLHMDFVRYPGVDWGYSAEAVALYMRQYGTATKPAPDDLRWQAWRRAQVTAFVKNLHDDIKKVKPRVKLSGALICFGGGPGTVASNWQYTSAYQSVFQDWRAWMANGYLDIGVPMNYDSDWSSLEKGFFARWLDFEKDSGFANRLLTGVGAFLNYPEGTLAQIRRALAPSARGHRVLGIAIYSYGSTSVYGNADFYNDRSQAAYLPRQPYYGNVTRREPVATRGRAFNDSFMTQLSQPDIYWDVALGWVATKPVFTRPAQVPGS